MDLSQVTWPFGDIYEILSATTGLKDVIKYFGCYSDFGVKVSFLDGQSEEVRLTRLADPNC